MTQIVVLSGSSQTSPADWSNINTIEVLGGGGGAAAGSGNTSHAVGGAGGGYAAVSNDTSITNPGTDAFGLTISPGGAGTTASSGGSGGTGGTSGSQVNSPLPAVIVATSSLASLGGNGTAGQSGGTGTTGTTLHTGGNGGSATANATAAGGGGAAGPAGNGTNGVSNSTINTASNGGAGSGGAAAGTSATGSANVAINGGVGGTGTGVWGTAGPGGGGGAAINTSTTGTGAPTGGKGGNYGAGGGGGLSERVASVVIATGGSGTQGLAVFTYTPAARGFIPVVATWSALPFGAASRYELRQPPTVGPFQPSDWPVRVQAAIELQAYSVPVMPAEPIGTFVPTAWTATAKASIPPQSRQGPTEPMPYPVATFYPEAWQSTVLSLIAPQAVQFAIFPPQVIQVFYARDWPVVREEDWLPKQAASVAALLPEPIQAFIPLPWPSAVGSWIPAQAKSAQQPPLPYPVQTFSPIAWVATVSDAIAPQAVSKPSLATPAIQTFVPRDWPVSERSAIPPQASSAPEPPLPFPIQAFIAREWRISVAAAIRPQASSAPAWPAQVVQGFVARDWSTANVSEIPLLAASAPAMVPQFIAPPPAFTGLLSRVETAGNLWAWVRSEFFTPVQAFAFLPPPLSEVIAILGSSDGGIYDVRVKTSLWQDTAGTIPVQNVGDPVRLIQDLSPNHLDLKDISASPPTYQIDDNGFPYLLNTASVSVLASVKSLTMDSNWYIGATGSHVADASTNIRGLMQVANATTGYFRIGTRPSVHDVRAVARAMVDGWTLVTAQSAGNVLPDLTVGVISAQMYGATDFDVALNGTIKTTAAYVASTTSTALGDLIVFAGDATGGGGSSPTGLAWSWYRSAAIDRVLSPGERQTVDAWLGNLESVVTAAPWIHRARRRGRR